MAVDDIIKFFNVRLKISEWNERARIEDSNRISRSGQQATHDSKESRVLRIQM